jgi:hypothetical protein
MQNNAMMQERQRRQFAMEDEELNRNRRIDEAYRGAITNVDGKAKLDEGRLLSSIYDVAPREALKLQEGFSKRDAENQKLQIEAQKAALAQKVETSKYLRDLLPSVIDQQSYDAYLQEAQAVGATGILQSAPPEFNPKWVESNMYTSGDFIKKAEVELNRGVTMRGQDITMRGQDLSRDTTIRGQDLSAATTRRGQDITIRGQNLTDARAKETNAGGAKAPSGYRFLADGSLEAIKGGPADIKAGELGAKTETRKQMQLGTTANTIDAVDTALKQAGFLETGMTGALMSKVAGSDAYNLRKTAETIKANLGFNELQAMREASPTGGALGAIAVQELTALQSTIANIDPNQSQAQLKANLKKVRKHVNAWRKTLGGDEIPEQAEPQQGTRGGTVPPPPSGFKVND